MRHVVTQVDYLVNVIDHHGEPGFPNLLAALDTFQARMGAALAARAGRVGVRLRGSHGRILHLVPSDGCRPSQLAEGWISKQAVGMRVQELVRMGLVVVEPDPTDRRASLVRRTPEGDATRDRTSEAVTDIEDELRAQVGAERYAVFRAVLDELAWPWAPALLVEQVERGDDP